MADTLLQTNRSRVRRSHDRASYDRSAAYAQLDAQPICSVGYVMDGRPYVTPTLQWRRGNRVFWHGSPASSALRAGAQAVVCLTVAILDGFVMARSGFDHSVNARSLTLFGMARPLDDDEKLPALEDFMERLWHGRNAVLAIPGHIRDFQWLDRPPPTLTVTSAGRSARTFPISSTFEETIFPCQ